MAFTLPDLPYSHDALAGLGMSAETLEYHHDLHHNAYVVNGNKLIAGTEWEGKSLEDIIQSGVFPLAFIHLRKAAMRIYFRDYFHDFLLSAEEEEHVQELCGGQEAHERCC